MTREELVRRLRPAARDLGSALLHATGLTHPRLHGAGKLTVVTFHRVLPEAERDGYPIPELAVTPDELDFLLALFRRHYTAGTLQDTARRFLRGERAERPLLAITFDDGQRDNYVHALPVLARHGLTASFFVVTGAVDANAMLWHDRIARAVQALHSRAPAAARDALRELHVPEATPDPSTAAVAAAKGLRATDRDAWLARVEAQLGELPRPTWDAMLDWDQLRELAREGHEIGSHSVSHAILPLLGDDDLWREVDSSRRALQEQLGRPVTSFCYPNGDHDARVAAAVERAGYELAVTTRYGLNTRRLARYALRRCDLQGRHARDRKGGFSAARISLRLSGRLPGLA